MNSCQFFAVIHNLIFSGVYFAAGQNIGRGSKMGFDHGSNVDCVDHRTHDFCMGLG